MKMKKQILTIALIGMLICLSASADTYIHDTSAASMDVSMTIEEALPQITIPAELPIEYGSECASLSIGIDEMHLFEGHCVCVSAQTDGALVDTNDEANTIEFSINSDQNTVDGEAKLFFEEVGTQNMYVHIQSDAWDNAVSGSEYTGVITFVFNIESADENNEPNEGGDMNA